jgi:hypothetical protein
MARKADIGAQVGVAFSAPLARVARIGRVHSNPLAVERAALNRPSKLVAKHEGLDKQGVTDAALGEPVEVGAANADRRHTHKALSWAWFWARLVQYLDDPGPFQPDNFHLSPGFISILALSQSWLCLNLGFISGLASSQP